MSEEIVTLVVAGYRWRAWTRANVTYSAKQAARMFGFTLVDKQPFDGQWNFMPGTECSVYAGRDLLVRGYINQMDPSYDKEHHKVEIIGRSKAQDIIDGDVDHNTGEFNNKTILEIANEMDLAGVGFKADVPMQKINRFRVNSGETVFRALERARRKEGFLLIGQADGSVLITKGGTTRVHPSLKLGRDFLAANATFSDGEKYSDYKIRGQRSYGHLTNKSIRVEGSAKDPTVKRKRTRVMHSETDMDDAEAKKRARDTRDRQQGNSVSATLRVQGWRDKNGVLWTPNTLVYIYDPNLKIDMDMLLSDVSLSQDNDSGTIAQLTFVQPKALGSTASTGSRTNDVWQYDPEDED
jgi:prophage tail gpP-like protein